MALRFSSVCDLLEALHKQAAAGNHRQARDTLQRWFHHHRQLVASLDGRGGVALLSTLLPARRTDRVYCIQAPRLEKIFARAQRLGVGRVGELYRYKAPGSGVDLADCIFTILNAAPNPAHHVTVSEVDSLLDAIASTVAFSSPAIRAAGASLVNPHGVSFESIYRRLTPLEAKWFTRLVLKDYRPIDIEEAVVLRCYHFALPCIMKVLDHFSPALAVLEEASRSNGRQGGAAAGCNRQSVVLRHLKPVLGTKVGRPPWRKARSIKHCLDSGHGRMSVEKKIDGEYCQVHVDLSKGRNCIQIYSKSGKDSTDDRSRLHRAIRESLDIGKSYCKVTKGCILEGELVVYSDLERKVLPFHKIRNHVTRSGRYMNNGMDSPPRAYEHLMIIYYDVLLIDDESLLGVRHSQRFGRLKRLIVTQQGYAELVDRHVIDLGRPQAASDLRRMFAETILAREEGLVLKPDDPFINLDKPGVLCGSPIKLKKEYIGTFGDVGDFAVVGARYDPNKAKCYRIPGLKWTHFYLGCPTSKSELYTNGAVVPEFTIVAVVELNETMLKTVVSHSQPLAVSAKENRVFQLTMPSGLANGKHPSVVFTKPLVFDLRCFSFDKEGNVGFYTPRFPVVSKVHFDRDYRDTVTFSDLQELAAKATTEKPWEDRDSQELLGWIAALEGADPRGAPVDCATQQTASTEPTPSPVSVRAGPARSLSVDSWDSSQERSSQVSLGSERMTMTPPTSLPAEPPSSQAEEVGRSGSPPSRKRKCGDEDGVHVWGSSPPSRRRGTPPPDLFLSQGQSRREPLAEVVNGASQGSSATDDAMATVCTGSPKDASSQPVTEPGRSHKDTWAAQVRLSPSAASTASSDSSPKIPHRAETRGPCSLAGRNCVFRDRPVLLAPSVAAREDVTGTLLPRHGVHSYVTDHVSWGPEDVDRPGSWKICLVSRDDRAETLGFLGGVEERPLRVEGGREYIEVYDWRVLEAVRDGEVRGRGLDGGDAFKRWFVGLV